MDAISITRDSEPPGAGPYADLIARHPLLAAERRFTARYGGQHLRIVLAERNALLGLGARDGDAP